MVAIIVTINLVVMVREHGIGKSGIVLVTMANLANRTLCPVESFAGTLELASTAKLSGVYFLPQTITINKAFTAINRGTRKILATSDAR